jgi:transposase-like protein
MYCPRCRCPDVDSRYCGRERKTIYRCLNCGATWEMNEGGRFGY